MSWSSAPGTTAAGRVMTATGWAAAYFGQKTGEWYRANLEVPFFNHFLKDKGDISKLKEVNLFDTGANEWRTFENYEPTGGTDTALYLTQNGGLSFVMPTAAGNDEYVSDPSKPVPYTQKVTRNYPRDFMTEDQRFVSTTAGCVGVSNRAAYRGRDGCRRCKAVALCVLKRDGFGLCRKAHRCFSRRLYVSAGQRPPQNSAWSVFQPGGYQMLLRGEPMPARFRNGFEKPEPLKPNEPTRLAYVMPGVTHTFKKGHRIMVQVQSTMVPARRAKPAAVCRELQNWQRIRLSQSNPKGILRRKDALSGDPAAAEEMIARLG